MEVPAAGSGRCPAFSRCGKLRFANCALRKEVALRARKPQGSVVFNRLRATWNFLWCEGTQRRSIKLGTITELPTRNDALRKAETARRDLRLQRERSIPTVRELVQEYRAEKMPQRYSTRRGYEEWIKNHILPRWADSPITDLQAQPVELWLRSLPLAPKSKSHIKGLLRIFWDFTMWRSDIPTERNPMELVTIKGVTRRRRQPRSLTVEEFHKFIQYLEEPFRTIALICVCFGLRISEALALKWSDVDWPNRKLSIERGIVRQRVDDVKTLYSGRRMAVDAEMLVVLKAWKQQVSFTSENDWMFASPVKLGRQPWCYDQVERYFVRAAKAAGIGRLGTHSMRHTYRSWLDAVGTPLAVHQKLMRHADIRTTMNVYGDVVTNEMQEAHAKVVQMALVKPN